MTYDRNNPANVDPKLYEDIPDKGLSLSAYARHRKAAGLAGCSYPVVKRAFEVGNITKNKHGGFDPKETDIQWFKNTDPSKDPLRHKGNEDNSKSLEVELDDAGIPAYKVSQARREFIKADLDQLKLDEAEGILIHKAEAYAVLFDLFRVVRDRLLNIPVRLGPELASMDDALEVEHHIEKEINQVLTELSDEGKRLAGDVEK